MTLDQVAEQWPDWRLWTSRNGGLVCATRRRSLTDAEKRAAFPLTLIEDSMPELIAQLTADAERER